MLLNLVQNARDATESTPGGEVRVVARAAGAGLVVQVIDGGPGISEDVRQRMFEPYFTTKDSGTGLGLAIVQRIVTEHGGSIDVSCPPPGGDHRDGHADGRRPAPSPDDSVGERR